MITKEVTVRITAENSREIRERMGALMELNAIMSVDELKQFAQLILENPEQVDKIRTLLCNPDFLARIKEFGETDSTIAKGRIIMSLYNDFFSE